jgi:glutathione S-transferase
MLRLHGFSASNYYNIAKLALLEKELPFEEVLVYTGADETHHPEYLDKSPLGKVPCLETAAGFISESRCIVDYLERAYPARPLYPSDPFALAKTLELTQIVELYLELAARRLLPNLLRNTPAPDRVAAEVLDTVRKGAKALSRLALFDAFVLGPTFGAANPEDRAERRSVRGRPWIERVPGARAVAPGRAEGARRPGRELSGVHGAPERTLLRNQVTDAPPHLALRGTTRASSRRRTPARESNRRS